MWKTRRASRPGIWLLGDKYVDASTASAPQEHSSSPVPALYSHPQWRLSPRSELSKRRPQAKQVARRLLPPLLSMSRNLKEK
jgi:hypothetical protein